MINGAPLATTRATTAATRPRRRSRRGSSAAEQDHEPWAGAQRQWQPHQRIHLVDVAQSGQRPVQQLCAPDRRRASPASRRGRPSGTAAPTTAAASNGRRSGIPRWHNPTRPRAATSPPVAISTRLGHHLVGARPPGLTAHREVRQPVAGAAEVVGPSGCRRCRVGILDEVEERRAVLAEQQERAHPPRTGGGHRARPPGGQRPTVRPADLLEDHEGRPAATSRGSRRR